MTPDRQAELIAAACRQVGLDSHIRRIERRKEAQTWAEKISVQFMQAGQQFPVKNSYIHNSKLCIQSTIALGFAPSAIFVLFRIDLMESNTGLFGFILSAGTVLENRIQSSIPISLIIA